MFCLKKILWSRPSDFSFIQKTYSKKFIKYLLYLIMSNNKAGNVLTYYLSKTNLYSKRSFHYLSICNYSFAFTIARTSYVKVHSMLITAIM